MLKPIPRERFGAIPLTLLFITLLAAIPRLYVGSTQYVEYDGYWHVFIAMQDNLRQFYKEYWINFHPPLFYLLLRLALNFGRTPLVYRSISLLTGIAAVFFIGKIAEKISVTRWMSAVAALIYGLALPTIVISCEVRSYMLCMFFLLVSFYCFLDLLGPSSAERGKSRTLFASFAILAGLSHYMAFFYVMACAVVLGLFDLFSREKSLSRLLADIFTFIAIGCALAYPYYSHVRHHAYATEHLHTHYFHAGGGESVAQFLMRNGRELLNLFSPLQIESWQMFYFILAASLLGGAWLVYLIRPLRRPENLHAGATLLITVIILAALMAGGVLDKYPFGGALRQQFILFPFLVLCACALLDRLVAGIRNKWIASAVVLAVVAANTAAWARAFERYPMVRTELYTAEINRFREDFPAPHAIYVDGYDRINLFIHYHDWNWHFVGVSSAASNLDPYRVSRANDNFLVFIDTRRWSLDLADPAWYADVHKCLQSQNLPSIAVLYLRPGESVATSDQISVLRNQIVQVASNAGLCVQKLDIAGAGVFVGFQEGPCQTETVPSKQCKECDDLDSNVVYMGTWTRGDFDQAWKATLTYSDKAGATARLVFEGTAVTYVYTKAFNRGIAAVVIDGVRKGVINLYSSDVEYQSKTSFGGLQPGRHTIEVRVLGRHSPASSGSFVDIDAFLVR